MGNQRIGVNLCSLYPAFGLRCSPTAPRSRREGSEREMLRVVGVASGLTPATAVSEEGGQAMSGQRHKRIGLAGGGSWIQLAGVDDSACCQDPRVLRWSENGRGLALRTEAAGARASPGHGVGIARGVASRLGRVVSCFGLGDWRAFGPARQGDSVRGQASIQFFRRRQRAGQKKRGLPRPGIGRQCETSWSTIARAPAAKHQLPGSLRTKLRKCLYGDGVTRLANEQTEAPWQRKMVLHHDDMLRIMSGNASDSPWCV